jgi:hypothetical protein
MKSSENNELYRLFFPHDPSIKVVESVEEEAFSLLSQSNALQLVNYVGNAGYDNTCGTVLHRILRQRQLSNRQIC